MDKRTRRQAAVAPSATTTAVAPAEGSFNPSISHSTTPPSLEHVRAESLRQRSDSARTIAELEAWRDEIDSTIAFLKAQRK